MQMKITLMQVKLNPLYMFTRKVVILLLPKKWHKMVINNRDDPLSTPFHIAHTTNGSVIRRMRCNVPFLLQVDTK